MDTELALWLADVLSFTGIAAAAAVFAAGLARRSRHRVPDQDLTELGAFDRLPGDAQKRAREALENGTGAETHEEAAAVRGLAAENLRRDANPWFFAGQVLLGAGVAVGGLRWAAADFWSFQGILSTALAAAVAVFLPWSAADRRRRHRRARAALAANTPDAGRAADSG
ncbi:hypothetical protein [Nocardiopsis coralliicola]